MYLIQILLPTFDNEQAHFPDHLYTAIRDELTEHFGGITTYIRSPAQGFWKESPRTTIEDEIIIFEIMTNDINKEWWNLYKDHLTRLFRQESLIVRAMNIVLL